MRNDRSSVSKGGLVQLTRPVAVEYGRDGVLCKRGRAWQDRHRDTRRPQDAESAAYVRGRTPFGRLGELGDVAAAVAFLAADDAGYISGVNLMADGGWMAC